MFHHLLKYSRIVRIADGGEINVLMCKKYDIDGLCRMSEGREYIHSGLNGMKEDREITAVAARARSNPIMVGMSTHPSVM